jgi:hypothetical protein
MAQVDLPALVRLSEGLGSSKRHHARALRIRELQAKLRALLDEEAAPAAEQHGMGF